MLFAFFMSLNCAPGVMVRMFNIGHPSESFLEASTVPDVHPSLAGCRGRSGSSGEGPPGRGAPDSSSFPSCVESFGIFNAGLTLPASLEALGAGLEERLLARTPPPPLLTLTPWRIPTGPRAERVCHWICGGRWREAGEIAPEVAAFSCSAGLRASSDRSLDSGLVCD